MAGGSRDLDTNADVARLVDALVADPEARLLFMPVALCDFTASVLEGGAPTPSGKGEPRLRTGEGPVTAALTPAPKVIGAVRRERKVFSRNADPERVIRFIEESFDLAGTTAGFPLG